MFSCSCRKDNSRAAADATKASSEDSDEESEVGYQRAGYSSAALAGADTDQEHKAVRYSARTTVWQEGESEEGGDDDGRGGAEEEDAERGVGEEDEEEAAAGGRRGGEAEEVEEEEEEEEESNATQRTKRSTGMGAHKSGRGLAAAKKPAAAGAKKGSEEEEAGGATNSVSKFAELDAVLDGLEITDEEFRVRSRLGCCGPFIMWLRGAGVGVLIDDAPWVLGRGHEGGLGIL